MTRLRYLLEALTLWLAFALLGRLGVDTASNLGGFLGRSLGPRLPVSARARRNLRLAFPEKTAAETEAILRGMWDNLGRVTAEYPHLGRITRPEAGRVAWIDIEPIRRLRDGHSAGILASAHLANWEILPVTAARFGLDLTAIVREPNNPFVRTMIDRLRGVAGGDRAAKGAEGAKRAIEVLGSGRVLGVLYDQKLSDGIAVSLFGIEAMTAPAPAQLALRFGCPLVPVHIERSGPGRFRVIGHAPLEPRPGAERHAEVVRLTTELNRILEGWIRARPQEWLWLHRRWPEAAYREREAG